MTHIWRQILKPPKRYLVDLTSREFPQVDLEAFATALSHEDGYSLDAFVETHPRFLAVGKVGIARALIPCEADSHLSPYVKTDGTATSSIRCWTARRKVSTDSD